MITKFLKVPYNSERGEFERVAKDFSGGNQKAFLENKKSLEKKYSVSRLYELRDDLWKKLENTDSYLIENMNDIKKAVRKNSASSGNRNIENVFKEFINGSVRAPIILCYDSNKKYTLVAGNTRLMVARLMKIKPKCCFIKTDW